MVIYGKNGPNLEKQLLFSNNVSAEETFWFKLGANSKVKLVKLAKQIHFKVTCFVDNFNPRPISCIKFLQVKSDR